MCHTKNCYQNCINPNFLIPTDLWEAITKIVSGKELNAKTGRPSIESERALNGIYYLLKTGVHWNALPRCFGSSSAVHRFFQKLVRLGLFEKLWSYELDAYNTQHGLNLSHQAADCSFRKSPLGQELTGKSPVDRRKLGSKLSIISDSKGIVIGMAVGAAHSHDSKLFIETLLSVPESLKQPQYKEMHLDSAYDSQEIKTALFNHYYVPKIAPNRRKRRNKPLNPLGYSRWFIEPVHAWLNKFRAIFIRYCKYAKNYLALAQFAVSIIISNKI